MCSLENVKSEVLALKSEVSELKQQVGDLVTLLTQARGALVFIKWLTAFFAALGSAYIFFKYHVLK